MALRRSYINKSSINFTEFAIPQKDPQQDKIYGQPSTIQEYMNDQITISNKTENKFYQNRIFNSTTKYEVFAEASFDRKAKQNRTYLEFFRNNSKFVKPSGQNTKYSDLLSKNQKLLRRGQFQIPLEKDKGPKLERKTKHYRNIKNLRYTAQPKSFTSDSTNHKKSTRQAFGKTISTQFDIFQHLLNKQRSEKSQRIRLTNSMNRIIASQSINLEINPASKFKRQSTTIQY